MGEVIDPDQQLPIDPNGIANQLRQLQQELADAHSVIQLMQCQVDARREEEDDEPDAVLNFAALIT